MKWFPLALVAILLLTLPALVLFSLDLLGYEGQANRWLEERFDLSHHVPLSEWAAGLLFLVPPLLILLYFLKLKRQTAAVPSTFLWKKSVEDLHVNRLMQWLRKNVLLLLQLLVILFILYAIIAPRLHGERTSGRHYIIMIDNSASMSATDEDGETRLGWAKAEALKEIDAATEDDFGMVVVFNSAAEIRQSYTSNQAQLRSAVEAIEPTQRRTRIDEALRLAESLANPLTSAEDESARPIQEPEPGKARTYVPAEGIPTQVHLYSDGGFPDVEEFALVNLDLRYHSAGRDSGNVGVVNFDALRDEADPTRVQVFARLANFGDTAKTVSVRVDVFVDGDLAYPLDRTVTLPPRRESGFADPDSDDAGPIMDPGEAQAEFRLDGLDRESDVRMHLRLVGTDDVFPLDDESWLVMGLIRKARVLIVGPGNPALEVFFDSEATRQVAEVTYLTPDQLNDPEAYLDPARAGGFDLVVFDRCAPGRAEDMPRASTFFIGRAPPTLAAGEPETVEFPQVRGWSDEHAVMRGLSGWHRLQIAEAFRLPELPPRTPRLLEGDQNLVLMAALSRGSFTDLVLAFPIRDDQNRWNTRWFLEPGFVLFLRNVLYSLGGVRDAATDEVTRPGEVKRLRPTAAVDEIRVDTPGDGTIRLDRGNRAEFSFADTETVGVYRARWDGGERSFAVNLFDERESDLQPRPSVKIGAEVINAGEGRDQPRELWKWAVLAGLLFLLVEWYVYNRRVHV